MKCIDSEKLIAEIRRRIDWLNTATGDFAEGRRAEIRSLYDYIGYLQQEQQEVDLEKEIEKAQEHYFALKDKGFSLDSMDVSMLARHFYELGRKGGEI